MSYQTGTATDPEDLIGKLATFLTGTPGWTQDLYSTVNDRAVFHKAGVSRYIQFQWDANNLGLAMIGGYSGDVVWTSQPNCEFTSAAITNVRYCNIMTGPYPSYHFFEDDNYFHVVVEISSGIYRHFGFGQMTLVGGLGGGAYAYGHYWDQGATAIDDPNSAVHAPPVDGKLISNTTRGFGAHITGLTMPDANTKYFRQMSATFTTDNDGHQVKTLAVGGWRDSQNNHFMAARASDLNGFKPLMPVPLYASDRAAAPDIYYLAGYVKDLRAVNLFGLNVAQELTVGSDTWVVFPITRKGNNGLAFNQEQSYNFGLAYKKVTT